jgi:hypothetical protein
MAAEHTTRDVVAARIDSERALSIGRQYVAQSGIRSRLSHQRDDCGSQCLCGLQDDLERLTAHISDLVISYPRPTGRT